MSSTLRLVWIVSVVLAGTAVVLGTSAVRAGAEPAQNFRSQDAGSGTLVQNKEEHEKKSDVKKTRMKTQTLTGCLQQGEDPNEFNLTAKDGGTWEIKSDNVKLDKYVGHTVKVIGEVSNAATHEVKEDTKAEMKDHGMAKHTTEHGHMTVTDLATVSDTCKK